MRNWILTLALIATSAAAQSTDVQLGGLKADPSQPVQVTSDQLSIDQKGGTALFTGHVVVTQGTMVMNADKINVTYAEKDKSISAMHAEGDVKLTSGTDAASADQADYAPGDSGLVLSGNVLLTQGGATVAGQKLTLDLKTGLGHMEGRVTTTFTPKAKGG